MDETGKELMCLQTQGLEAAFDVRCFVIPPDELTSWDVQAEQVVALTQAELEKTPRPSVYLCGESFGGCIALKVLQKFPQLFAPDAEIDIVPLQKSDRYSHLSKQPIQIH